MLRLDRLFLAVLVFFTIAYTGFYAQFHIDPHHDGIILKPAVDILHGKKLFVDTFTQYGALTTLIHAGFMKLFGETLYIQRMSAVVFYALSAILLYFLSRKLFPPLVAFGIGCLWLVTAYFPNREIIVPFLAWSSVYALTFQLASSLALIEGIEKENELYFFISGVACALAFWARQPVGIFLVLAVVCILGFRLAIHFCKKNAVTLILFVFGVVSASAPFFIWLLSIHGAHDWWLQSIVLAFNFGNNLSGSFSLREIFAKLLPSVLDSKKNLLWLAAIASAWFLFVTQLLWILLKRKNTKVDVWVRLTFGVVALSSWMQFFPANDQSHFFWAGTPMLTVLILVSFWLMRFVVNTCVREYQFQSFRWQQQLVYGITVIFILFLSTGFLVTDLKGLRWYTKTPFETLRAPAVLAGMRVPIDEEIVLDRVESRLRAYFVLYPKKTYINASPDALYPLLDPHNATFYKMPVYWDWTIQPVFTDYLQSMSVYLKAHRPAVIWRDPVPLPNYCADDLSIHYPVRVQMYQRPLIVSLPVEDIADIGWVQSTVHIFPKAGEIKLKSATYSAQAKTQSLVLGSDPKYLQIPKGVETVYLDFTNELAGECQVAVPMGKNLTIL